MATKNLGRIVGLSAYEVWLEQGNIGTEEDFLNSLRGAEITEDKSTISGRISLIDDNTKWINSHFINYNGGSIAKGTNAYFCVESFLPVEAGKCYYVFLNGVSKKIGYWAFYDVNYNCISTCDRNGSYDFIVAPNGAKYFRFSVQAGLWGITAGSQVIDENGKLTNPTKVEFFEQMDNTYREPSPVTINTNQMKNTIKVDGSNIIDGSIDLSKCKFAKAISGKNLWNPETTVSGYNAPTTNLVNVSNNSAYVCTAKPIPVNPGDNLTFWRLDADKKTAKAKEMRYVSAININMMKDTTNGAENVTSYIVPEGIYYVMLTAQLNVFDSNEQVYVQKSPSTSFEGYVSPTDISYKIDSTYIDGDLGSGSGTVVEPPTLHFFLPPEICIADNCTIELYNNQVCLEADKYHIQWIGTYGAAYDWKYTITGDESLNGKSFNLTCNVVNDKLQTIATKTTTVRFVSSEITKPQLLIPIGDSLTNQKYWIKHIYTNLSSNNIAFRGTRGTTDPKLVNGITHEGRSGAGSGWYNAKTSKYGFDRNGLSTLESCGFYDNFTTTSGEAIEPVYCNPFWHLDTDKNIDKFDFDFYCNSVSDNGAGLFQDTNGNNISLTPTGVVIYLGANGMKTDSTDAVNNIRTLIENLRASTKGATIPIYVMLLQFRAPYILSTNADGFATNSTGMYKFLSAVQHHNLEVGLYNELSSYENVYFIPLATTMDSTNDYPYTEVGVNPYVEDVKMKKFTDTVHPTDAGFKQIGDILFGSIAYHSQQ